MKITTGSGTSAQNGLKNPHRKPNGPTRNLGGSIVQANKAGGRPHHFLTNVQIMARGTYAEDALQAASSARATYHAWMDEIRKDAQDIVDTFNAENRAALFHVIDTKTIDRRGKQRRMLVPRLISRDSSPSITIQWRQELYI